MIYKILSGNRIKKDKMVRKRSMNQRDEKHELPIRSPGFRLGARKTVKQATRL